MRTTLDLPDDLMRSVKVRAAQSDRTLTDVITGLLRAGLDAAGQSGSTSRVRLPLVRNSRTAMLGDLSPERLAGILESAEVADLTKPGADAT